MDRRRFLLALGGGVLSGATMSPAQTTRKVFRIGYLAQIPLVDPPSPERAAFLNELRKLGYSVGENLLIEYRSAENEPEFLEDLAKELAQRNVDAIVTASSVVAAQAAARAVRSTPIVFIGVPDPLTIGLVRSLARPEANVTGLAWESENLIGKRIELLREIIPGASKLAIIWNPRHPESQRSHAVILKLTQAVGMATDEYQFSDAASLRSAFETIARRRPDALYVITDPRIVAYRQMIADEALRLRLPSVFGYQGYPLAGGLMSYSADLADLYRRAATYVDKILKGAKPTDLPVEQPTKFELVINMKTAKALGLMIPHSVLLRADEVIQ